MSKSSNAITAKARAMLAEHLKPVDYATMLQRKTVGDIAIFLQSQPLYKESLEGINPKSIHRGQLEVLLRTGVFNRFAKLIRYADDNAKHFGHIAVMETEIELILMKLHSLSCLLYTSILTKSGIPCTLIGKVADIVANDLGKSISCVPTPEVMEITLNSILEMEQGFILSLIHI